LPTSGRITLDGHDINELTLSSLRANIALVSQEVVLFNDTLAANIAYGQEREVSAAEIIAAATAAHAMEFIREWPEGLQTLVGERGVKLSGGQRQRIAIARAILKDAPILILDEATSALDSESERHVQAALETLMQGRTTLVIAHRLSTIENADRIVVMQKGEIVETGTHRELLEKSGVYAQLHRIQFAATA
jgi:subfamily B ATP-binding cassette protein MsbA